MVWIILVLACIACWSTTDLFYKKGSDYEDRLSHLKFMVWLGIIMGLSAFLLFPWSESGVPFGALVLKYVDYMPFALAYVLALMCGIIGARHLGIYMMSRTMDEVRYRYVDGQNRLTMKKALIP